MSLILKAYFKRMLLIFVFLQCFFVFGQDVLKEEIDSLIDRGKHYYRNLDFNKAEEIIDDVISKSKGLEYNEGEINGILVLALIHYQKGNFVKTVETYKKALKIAKILDDPYKIGQCLSNIALTTSRMSSFNSSVEYYAESIRYLNKVKKQTRAVKISLISSYQGLGYTFYRLEQYGKSIEYFNLAIDVIKNDSESNYYSYELLCLISLGDLYSIKNEEEKALSYFNLSEKLLPKIESKSLYVHCGVLLYENISSFYLKQNSLEISSSYLEKGFDIIRSSGIENGKPLLLLLQGEINKKKNLVSASEQSFLEAYQLSNSNNEIDIELKASKELATLYSNLKHYEKASHFYDIYTKLNDSINNNKRVNIVANLTSKYDSERKDRELAENKLTIKEQENKF